MILALLAMAKDQPWLHENNPAIWSGGDSVSYRSQAGETVTPQTALGLPAYFACIRVLGEDTAKLPMEVNKKLAAGKSEPAPEKREVRLLNEQANPDATAMTVREFLVAQAAGWGNGYGELQWLNNGKLNAIYGLQSSRMKTVLVKDNLGNAKIRYLYKNDWGQEVEIQSEDLIHIVGPTQNGLVGVPVARFANESLGSGLAQQKFAGAFFGNGAIPGGVLEHPGVLSQEAQDRLRTNWEEIHRSAGNAFRVGILEEGMKYSKVTVNPKDAETIETRRFTIEEVARWFRMPISKIQHHLNAKGWSTTELENTHYLTDTLLPWLNRVEQAFNIKLFPRGDHFVKHNTTALLRADVKARTAWYQGQWRIGALSINEIRNLEDMSGIGPDGDVRFVEANMQTLDKAIEGPDDPPPVQPPPTRPPPQDDDEEEDDDEDENARLVAMRPWVQQAADRIMRKERKAMERIVPKHKADRDALALDLAKFFDNQVAEMREAFAPGFGNRPPAALSALCLVFRDEAVAAYLSGNDARIAERHETAAAGWAVQVLILLESAGKHEAA